MIKCLEIQYMLMYDNDQHLAILLTHSKSLILIYEILICVYNGKLLIITNQIN